MTLPRAARAQTLALGKVGLGLALLLGLLWTQLDPGVALISTLTVACTGLGVWRWASVQREDQHELARTRLMALIANSGVPMAFTALEDGVRVWNAAARNLLGYSSSEMLGHPVLKLLPDASLRDSYQSLRLRVFVKPACAAARPTAA